MVGVRYTLDPNQSGSPKGQHQARECPSHPCTHSARHPAHLSSASVPLPVGYFVPATSGSYTFKMSADDYGFMWLDTATTTGAKSAPPTGGNALVQNQCCGVNYSSAVTLTAGQGYAFRAQFANAANGTPGHLTLYCGTAGVNGAFNVFSSGGPCGGLYYNPATISSTNNPGY